MQATSFNTPLLAASGKPLKALGSVDITFQLQGLLIPHTFIIIEDLYPTLILGADFLRKNNASISYTDNTVLFYDNLICAQLQSFNSARNCASVAQTVCMPKCSKAIIPVKLPRACTASHFPHSLPTVVMNFYEHFPNSSTFLLMNIRLYSRPLDKHYRLSVIRISLRVAMNSYSYIVFSFQSLLYIVCMFIVICIHTVSIYLPKVSGISILSHIFLFWLLYSSKSIEFPRDRVPFFLA